MKGLFVVMSLCMSLQVFGAEKLMATITSDVDQNTGRFYLDISEDGTTAIGVHVVLTGPRGETVQDDYHTAERVIAEGATIIEQQGREAVRLEVEKFSVTKGGGVNMNYLYNGITGTRRITNLYLVRANNKFVLTDSSGKEINRLMVYGHRILGAVVGIRAVVPSFSNF